ncbi:MAG: hypothetical protein A2806_01610 [Candidatus Terrybacteria bacterium RIFCSPHIGHO2_01_FULL_48_17]|uniref:Proline--tRNA ligase n=1 Tax=Candidatus Terrybacteria bacterium RIFCSPHIGHO2_01_FULL_48_17 TaxID=1802362 RepID=A0A1G2PN20_9BACT|nr:MAG: hypothetical protein A2806_01610 [Candidatus Terrybacteria bacterium RIFCSPHIGHO2_01_FULL_48_17]OHA52693.1 MAG: hypothetical protein A3A30_03690 [Candidatus Terrybacteria bacterium RIFCSPLOWO2_01_FULL_48_14]
MRQSHLFLPIRREPPKDETFANAQLLLRAGFADKLMAGVFSIFPAGLGVVRNIEGIVRDELQKTGAVELAMPSLQQPKIWEETGRWKTLPPEMFQFKDRADHPIGLAMTHEEVVFDIVRRNIQSFRDLPLKLYQFQTKFRDEPRPKSGLMRGREFLMKDLYSFHATREDLEEYYEEVSQAYDRIFKRCGLKAVRVEAPGGIFTKNPSHEFQVVAEGGEDEIALCKNCDFAKNAELLEKGIKKCPQCSATIVRHISSEVGNIFRFYDKYAKDMNGYVMGPQGENLPIFLASYGIGISRLMATIVEVFHDERGIMWPESVAPFLVHIVQLGDGEVVKKEAQKIYAALQEAGLEVLYDDREKSAGEKFMEADLVGIPWRVVVSAKTVAQGKVEVKKRSEDKAELMTIEELVKRLKK